MKKFILSLISLFFIISSSQSQYDAQFSQNMGFLSVANPAMISIDGYAKVLGVLRQQWVGLKNSPSTFVLNMTVPLNTGAVTHGAGILFFNDEVGLFVNESVFLQYAYQKAFLDGTFSLGGTLGYLDNSFDGSKAFIPESDYHATSDELIPSTEENGLAADLSIGVAYYDKQKYAGISFAHITKPTIEIGDKTEFTVRPMLNFNAGYNIVLSNPLYTLTPSVFFKTDFVSSQIDVNTIVEYNKSFYGGLSYRYQDAIVLMVGVKTNTGMTVGYSYDITTSKLAKASGGSHEVYVNYNFKLDFSEKQKHKSIRIL